MRVTSQDGLRKLCEHVPRAERVHSDARLGPLHRQSRSHMFDRCLASIVWHLKLRDIHDMCAHACNEDDAALSTGLHETGSLPSRVERAVYVDVVQLPHAIIGIFQCRVILHDAGGGYDDVDPTICLLDGLIELLDGLLRRDVASDTDDLQIRRL
jgi:hypothetical protein